MIVLARPSPWHYLFSQNLDHVPSTAGPFSFYPRGRDALLAGLPLLGLSLGDVILVPAYICASITKPLQKMGYKVAFLDIESNLDFDSKKVLAAIAKYKVKAVLLVHFFGFPAAVKHIVEVCRPLGVKVIEDCCHSFLTSIDGVPVGSYGDAAIFSMRKTLPVPDGGALRFNHSVNEQSALKNTLGEPQNAGRYFVSRALEGCIAVLGWPNIYSETVDNIRRKLQRGGKVEEQVGVVLPTIASKPLLHYLADECYLRETSWIIQGNYNQLVEACTAMGLISYIPKLPVGCTPQWAILEDHSGKLVSYLRRSGIGACRWPWHELPAEVAQDPLSYPISNMLNTRLALLPVHQSIGPYQLARILSVLRRYVNSL